jgi:hypothetical protein
LRELSSQAGRPTTIGSHVAGVAQSAERLTRNEQVRGSIPLPGSERSEEVGTSCEAGGEEKARSLPLRFPSPAPSIALILVLGLLVLEARGASPQDEIFFSLSLTLLFALGFLALTSRPDQVVIGYKG